MLPGAYPDPAARVAEFWDLTPPIPMPRKQLGCPMCGGAMVPKQWRFHVRETGSPTPWRCDVEVKCMSCSAVVRHGIVVPRPYFDAAPAPEDGRWIFWRQAERILAAAGYLEEV